MLATALLHAELIGVILTLIAGFFSIGVMLYRQGRRDQQRQDDVQALCASVKELAEIDRTHADALQAHVRDCVDATKERAEEDANFRSEVRGRFEEGSKKMAALETTQAALLDRSKTTEADIKTLLSRIPAKEG